MFSLALVIGVISVALGQELTPFYGPCKDFVTVPVDAIRFKGGSYVNMHFYVNRDGYSCEYVWNDPVVRKDGEILLHDTWERTIRGIKLTQSISAFKRPEREGVYDFTKVADSGNTIKYTGHFLHFDPDSLYIICVCSDDLQFIGGKPQCYIETKKAIPPPELACTIKRVLAVNNMTLSDFDLVNNCDCTYIPYDSQCEGWSYSSFSYEEYIANCD